MDQAPTKNRSQILKTHGNEILMIAFGIIGLIVVALFFRSNFTGCDAFESPDSIANCQQTIATHSGGAAIPFIFILLYGLWNVFRARK